jgi:hypothetical protein
MKSRKSTFPVLVITLILLAVVIGQTHAGPLARQVEPSDQGVVAAPNGGALGSPMLIGDFSDQGVDAKDPAVAYNSQRQEYLVVWWNDRPGCDDIFGRLVSANGVPLGSRFPIANQCPGERWYPDVTYNTQRNEYLVVWGYSATPTTPPFCIRAQRLEATGNTIGSVIDITDCSSTTNFGFSPAVAYASTEDKYLVVWSGRASSATSLNVMGQVVAHDSSLIGGNFTIAQGDASYSHEEPDLAYNHKRNEYMVAWQRRAIGTTYVDIFCRRVQGNGTPMFPTSTEVLADSTPQFYPAVAAMPSFTSNGQYLVVWEDAYTPIDRDIQGRLMSGDGTYYSNVFNINSQSPHDTLNPSLAGNESTQQYFVSWTGYTVFGGAWHGAAGRIVLPSGALEDSFFVGAYVDHTAVSSGPHGDFLITYEDKETIASQQGVWGMLWGNRVYLPQVRR